jgi:hypothetical protein
LGNREAAMAASIYEQLVNEYPDVSKYAKELAAARELSPTSDMSQATSEEDKDESSDSKPDAD